MAKKIIVDSVEIKELLESGHYKIPVYQRAYDWDKDKQDDFFTDLYENPEPYFLGSMVCIDRNKESESYFEVVDGQQRLMTTSLLLGVIYKNLLSLKQNLDDQKLGGTEISSGDREKIGGLKTTIQTNCENIKKQLIMKNSASGEWQARFEPSGQNQPRGDNIIYRSLLADREYLSLGDIKFGGRSPDKRMKPVKAFHRLWSLVEKNLCPESAQHTLKDIEGSSDKLVAFFEKVSKARLILIEPVNSGQAHMYFKGLNARGMELSALDLLKNEIFSKLDEQRHLAANDDWQEILGNLKSDIPGKEKYGDKIRFLRHHCTLYRLDNPTSGGAKEDKIGAVVPQPKLFGSYEEILRERAGQESAKTILQSLKTASEHYGRILGTNLEKDDKSPFYEISDINIKLRFLCQIEGAPSYLLILYLLDRQKRSEDVNDDKIADIVDALCQFFLLNHLTDSIPTNALDRIFFGLVEGLRENRHRDSEYKNGMVSFVENALTEALPSDISGRFGSEIRGPIYDDEKKIARFILFWLERNSWKEEAQNQWIEHMENPKREIEHVLPQTLSTGWQQMLTKNDGETTAEKIQEGYLHQLGNLTILSSATNRSIQNSDFSSKVEKLKKNSDAILTSGGDDKPDAWGITTQKQWTAKEINARTEVLVQEFQNNFFNDAFKEKLKLSD